MKFHFHVFKRNVENKVKNDIFEIQPTIINFKDPKL